MKYLSLSLLACAFTFLTACGGGGGSSSSGSSNENTLAISDENATEVAFLVTSNNLATEGTRSTTADTGIASAQRQLATLGSERSALETSSFSETYDCVVSGTSSLNLTVNSNSSSTASFSGSLGLNNCVDNDGYKLNGSLSMSGALTDSGNSGEATIRGNMTLTELATSKTLSFADLRFDVEYAGDLTTYTESYYASGSLVDGGSYTVTTLVPVEAYDGSEPYIGTIKVTGAEGTTLLIEFDSSASGVNLTANGEDLGFFSYADIAE